MTKKFLRRHTQKLSKFNRKKKRKWRKPKGRDNKMREKRKGKPKTVSIGYKKKNQKEFPLVKNIMDLENLEKNSKARIGKLGKKKKILLLKKAEEKNVKFVNFNSNKFLRKIKKKEKQTKKENSKEEKGEEKIKEKKK